MNASGNARGGAWVAAQNVVMVAALILAPLRCCDWSGEWSKPTGIALVIAGAIFGIMGVRALGRNLTPFPRPRDGSQLVRHGIYSLVRHPLYTSIIGVTAGWSLCWRSLAALIVSLLLCVILDAKARLEERWLNEKFPDYRDYTKRVCRFVPWVY